MSKCYEFIEGLWRVWGKTLAEGRDPYRERSAVLGGLVLRPLRPISAPSSSASQLLEQQNTGFSWSVFPQNFFSSSAVEKFYFCLLETEYSVTFLHQGHRDGSSPPVIYEDFLRSRYPVTGGTACRAGKTAAFGRWVTALLSVRVPLLQKHNFHRYHHFLYLSWHLIFCFLALYFGLAQRALA